MIQTYGVRIGWADLPERIRAQVEAMLGGPVVRAVSQTGGFSPGTADRVITADGQRAFVKAVSSGLNMRSVELARAEAHVTARMPAGAPVPRLLGTLDDKQNNSELDKDERKSTKPYGVRETGISVSSKPARERDDAKRTGQWDTNERNGERKNGEWDDGEWVVLIHEDIEGRHPRTPWVEDEIRATERAFQALAALTTPAAVTGLPRAADLLAPQFGGWDRLAADPPADLDPWVAAHLGALRAASDRGLAAVATGATLAHCDVRADNLLVRPDGSVMVVDWPYACVGPAWLDTVLLAMNVLAHGGPGDRLLAGVEPRIATAVIAGFAGDFLDRSRHPSPGIPYVRAFQRAHADAVLPWLRRCLAG